VRSAFITVCCAAAPAFAQQTIPVVSVSSPTARTTTTVGAVLGIRELPGGRLLVNDAGRRRILIFDSTLTTMTVALDSTPGLSNSYGPRPAEIIRYRGDSTLMTEIGSQEVVVLDRHGRVVRALAMPTFPDEEIAMSFPFPPPKAMDNRGRLLAVGPTRIRRDPTTNFVRPADSTPIMRADLDSRQVDIVGALYHKNGGRNRVDPPQDGKRVVTTIRQPVPTVDAWAVLSDGTIAFVRGTDYRVDWVLADGTKRSTAKLPFDWKRLTDDAKQKLVDSARVVSDSLMAIRNRRANMPVRSDVAGGATGGGRSGGGGSAPGGQEGSIQRMEFVPLSEIPDYYPPIHANAAMADLDGNLWILPTTSAQSKQGELVYDVVNPQQGLFRRVRMPLGRSVAGFGHGVVYLQAGDRAKGFYLERVALQP
jgi:hypothetical protein